MKLSKVDFYLDWPVSEEISNLRQFVVKNLSKKGEIVRWSIIDIQSLIDDNCIKRIRIYAVLAH